MVTSSGRWRSSLRRVRLGWSGGTARPSSTVTSPTICIIRNIGRNTGRNTGRNAGRNTGRASGRRRGGSTVGLEPPGTRPRPGAATPSMWPGRTLETFGSRAAPIREGPGDELDCGSRPKPAAISLLALPRHPMAPAGAQVPRTLSMAVARALRSFLGSCDTGAGPWNCAEYGEGLAFLPDQPSGIARATASSALRR